MDYLPYDIHENIFSFINNKIDMFCYADAYESADLWKFCTLRLTKGIKNRYNKPRDVAPNENILKDFRFFVNYDGRDTIIICPCGRDLRTPKESSDGRIIAKIGAHIKTKIHKKNMLGPKNRVIPESYYVKAKIASNDYHEERHMLY